MSLTEKPRYKEYWEKDVLKELCSQYTKKEIADKYDVSVETIRRHIREKDIECIDERSSNGRSNAFENASYPEQEYWDGEVLKELYIKKEKSISEIADEYDVANNTIRDHLKNNNLYTEEKSYENKARFRLSGNSTLEGYPLWTATGDGNYALVHHLVMIAEGEDPEKVFGNNKWNVHHRNRFRCDNRPCNLELVDRVSHGKKHKGMNDKKWNDDDIEFVIKYMMGLR